MSGCVFVRLVLWFACSPMCLCVFIDLLCLFVICLFVGWFVLSLLSAVVLVVCLVLVVGLLVDVGCWSVCFWSVSRLVRWLVGCLVGRLAGVFVWLLVLCLFVI